MKNVIYKDLIYVILIGFLVATLAGLAVGSVDFFLYDKAGFTMNIFYFAATYFIASYIRRQYVESTKLYQILAVIFVLYGYFFSNVIFFTFVYSIDQFEVIFRMIFSIDYFAAYFNPINIIDGVYAGIIEYLFIIIFMYMGYTKTK